MSSSEEKTEEATSHKLQEARKKGDVAQSPELTGAIVFAAAFLLIWLASEFILSHIFNLFIIGFNSSTSFDKLIFLQNDILEMLVSFLWIVVPVCLVAFFASILGGLIQTRGVFSTDPLLIKFEKLNPAESIKNLFSTQQLGVFITMLLKICLLSWLLIWVLKNYIDPMINSASNATINSAHLIASALVILLGGDALIFLILGLLHYMLQYFEYLKRNRMSKSEQKKESKELNGDPIIKGELNRLRHEATSQPISQGMSRAQVVVTNPTHFAVALFYDPELVEVPLVVAKGEDESAWTIRTEAVKRCIPIMENPPLARSLHQKVAEGEYINDEHFEAVAEVYKWLKLLKQNQV